MMRQHTLRRVVSTRGVGLHTGAMIGVTLLPAPEGTGIVFRRTGMEVPTDIPARVENVVDTRLATTLGKGEAAIATVEHLMAALAGLGVDNALIEVDGPEVPVMDGSASAWVALLREAGLATQTRTRSILFVREDVAVSDGDRQAGVAPANGFKIGCTIDFKHPAIGRQTVDVEVTGHSFRSELANARTFCMMAEVEAMRARGLARGGSLANAVVVGEDGVLNPEGLRFPDECVRHKVLDAVGDLYLLGGPMVGAVYLFKAGHALHCTLGKALLARRSAYEWVRATDVNPETLPLRLQNWLLAGPLAETAAAA